MASRIPNGLYRMNFFFILFQGHDEEAVVDTGKISSTINTNFEKEELESKY